MPLVESMPRQHHETHERTFFHRALELSGIIAFFSLVVVVIVDYGAAIAARPILALPVLGALFVGYVVADFMSGLVHFTFDRFFTPQTPVLGAAFVTAFRQHHSDPVDITRHGFIATNGNNSLATVPVLLALVLLPIDETAPWALFLSATLLWAAVATFATNQFHKWAHQEKVPAVVAWLQRRHLILPKAHHQLHHTFPYASHYCITTGWLNGVLVAIGFWRTLETFLARVLRLPHFVETTPWEQIPGSPAARERQQILHGQP
jgi:ubiquitin-conjugating enzyme E2 variant